MCGYVLGDANTKTQFTVRHEKMKLGCDAHAAPDPKPIYSLSKLILKKVQDYLTYAYVHARLLILSLNLNRTTTSMACYQTIVSGEGRPKPKSVERVVSFQETRLVY